MAAISIFVNGVEIETEEGRTVLEAARAAGVDIPTLCHHPAVDPSGGCRMCLVEVEPRGQLQPSCTYPATNGLKVHTHSPKVISARRYVLELLFSERSHYCMYCAADGACELQDLAYEHDMDRWLYPRSDQRQPLDATRPFFIMDHNRCVLCRRCIRACSDLAGVHTLAMGERGAQSRVVADLDSSFGESTCISCGSCLDVCPVGALVDRFSSYRGGEADLERKETTCAECAVGCSTVVRTRSGRVVRIESPWGEGPSQGLLCRKGRFEPVHITEPRVTKPMVRQGDVLVRCSWDEALSAVAEALSEAPSLRALASARATNEELAAFAAAFGHAGARVSLLSGGAVAPAPGPVASLCDVQSADLVLALNAELDEANEVVASFMRRARDRGAKLVLAGSHGDRIRGPVERLGVEPEAVIDVVSGYASLVVVYGSHADTDLLDRLAEAGAKFFGLPCGTNAQGALVHGITRGKASDAAATTYIYAADELLTGDLPSGKVVVQACYLTDAVKGADIVLPALHWSEKSGHFTAADGSIRAINPVVPRPDWIRDDRDVLSAPLGIDQRAGSAS